MLQLDIDALNARFASGMDADALQVLVENQPKQDIDETRIYCRWVIEPGDSQCVQTGLQKSYIQLGVATLQIIVPQGTYMDDGYAVRTHFTDLFRGWRSADKALTVYQIKNETPRRDGYAEINCRIMWESLRHS